MQAAVFGFGGRIDRLHFALGALLLAMIAPFAALTLALTLAPDDPMRASAALADPGGQLVRTVALIVLPAVLWTGASLMARRCRDIGWNPAYILPLWAAAAMADIALAALFPALPLRDGLPTPLWLIGGLGFAAVLLVRPSAADDQNRRTIPA